MKKRAWPLVALFACASKESPPPHTEVASPPPSASASAADMGGIGLGNFPADAGHVFGTNIAIPSDGGVAGRLAPEIVQRVVRASFDRTKVCYERALKKTPTLTGRVATRFVIDMDGSVSSASPDASGTTLADPQVVDCVVGVFRTLQFPKPNGGIVTVVYPLIFKPDDDAP